MKAARKTVAAILVALMFGIVAPNIHASTADISAPPPSGTIGTPNAPSSELATETLTTRQVLSKRVERHGSESLSLTSRFNPANHVHAGVRLIAPYPATDTLSRAAIRGRAPPL